ncbi:MAG: DUF928 domain-containing protein [Brasilonema octagenarum HA4186-MV1]|jgi:hypothetical protein|nr:DUF928 domain-containing protein [Brasilonema octagenarum HA4186-MV1]
MYRIKPLLCAASLGVALAVELAIAPSSAMPIAPNVLAAELDAHEQPQISKVKNAKPKPSNPPPPPPPKNPDSSAPGGRRDRTTCPQDTEAVTTGSSLTALGPTTKPGLTLAERPIFLVYVPKTSAKTAEFSLRNQNGSGVYRTTVTLTKTPDIVTISLPSNAPPLEIKKRYTWSFAVICNPSDRIKDQFVTGTVQRTELEPTRLRQIEQAPLKQRFLLYQKDDIWYDALPILLELRRSQPNDSSISAAWREFLQSGGVDVMIDDKLKDNKLKDNK